MGAQSLPDKVTIAQAVQEAIDHNLNLLAERYNISVAELDEAVTWQSATIGVVALSRSRDYLHGLVEEVERAARRILNEHGAELADSFWDYLEN